MVWRLVALLAFVAGLSTSSSWAQSPPPPKWGPHIDFEGKAGNKRNIGEADVFLPLWQNADTLVFGNIKTRLDDDNSHEGNFGAGVRHMLPSGWNVGAYGYFDRRKTGHDNYFNQVTLGAEALSTDWDFRANVYLPEGRRSKDVDSLNTTEVSGTTVIFRGGEERSMRGIDGEIGWRVPLFDLDAGRALRLYGGAYRFYAEGVNPVQGPRARAELIFDEVPGLWEGSRLTLGAEAQHDDPRGGQVFAVARLRIPLQVFGESRANLTPLERRMTDPVVRDVDVVSQAGAFGAPEAVTQTTGGQAITVINSSSTAGADLDAALAAAGANSLVILSGSFDIGSNVTTLQTGQTVMGAGMLQLRSPSGRLATLVTPSAAIDGLGVGNGMVVVAENSTLTGLAITSTDDSARAIHIPDGAHGAVIQNNAITSRNSNSISGTDGIILSNANNVIIRNNRFTIVAAGFLTAHAILAGGGITATNLTIAGNTFDVTGAGSNWMINLQTPITINSAASTGNVAINGDCSNTTGFAISFADGTTCP